MFSIQDQVSAAARANLDAQFGLYAAFTSKALESMEKLINLNISAARATMEESAATTQQILAARDAREVMSLVSAQARPTLEKALAYSGHLANIATRAQAEYGRAAEEQFAQLRVKVNELAKGAAKASPPSPGNLLAIMDTAIGNAQAGCDQLARSSEQAAEAVEANINNAINQLSQASVETAEAARKDADKD